MPCHVALDCMLISTCKNAHSTTARKEVLQSANCMYRQMLSRNNSVNEKVNWERQRGKSWVFAAVFEHLPSLMCSCHKLLSCVATQTDPSRLRAGRGEQTEVVCLLKRYSRCFFSSAKFQHVTNSIIEESASSVPRIIIIFKEEIYSVYTSVSNSEFIIVRLCGEFKS